MTTITAAQAAAALQAAEVLYRPDQIEAALDHMAAAVTARLAAQDPLVLVVLNGALITAAGLVQRLQFPLRLGYVHATRYRGDTEGGGLHWVAPPWPAVAGETVLVVDDVLDAGDTLQALRVTLRQQGAAAVYSAVLVRKHRVRPHPDLNADFVGLEAPDRYLFGCGMDYHHYWRQLPAIYAVGDR